MPRRIVESIVVGACWRVLRRSQSFRCVFMRFLALIVSFSLPALRSQASDFSPPHLATWSDLDGNVSTVYAALTNEAHIYPPWLWHFTIDQGHYTFSPDGEVAAATNLFQCATQFNVPVWRVTVCETQTTPRAWLYVGAGGIVFRTNEISSSFNPRQWVLDAYGHDAPGYLSGTNLDNWYACRDRSRFELSLTLVNSNDWETLRAAERVAATNAPAPETPPPIPPADSNQLAFAGIQVGQTNTLGLWLYTPSNRPVALLTRYTLTATTNAWSLLGGVNAVAPFDFLETAMQAESAFYLAGFSDVDTDGDGIPDLLEIYVFGTNPESADSDGDDVSDYLEIYIFGTDPWNPDKSPPIVSILLPLAGEWKAVLP